MCWRRWACPSLLGPELAVECLRETGFMFLFAPLYHPAMKAVGPLRRALGLPHHLQSLRPATNPAGARAQVIGVLAPSKVLLVGRTLAALGAKRAFVVHGTDGIDELTTTGESIVARIEESETGESTLKAARVTPEMAGLPRRTLEQFIGGDVKTNAALLYDVLTGMPGARRDIVLLNAAAGLVAAGLAGDLKEGVRMGAEAIDSGQAAATLAKLRAFGAKHTGGNSEVWRSGNGLYYGIDHAVRCDMSDDKPYFQAEPMPRPPSRPPSSSRTAAARPCACPRSSASRGRMKWRSGGMRQTGEVTLSPSIAPAPPAKNLQGLLDLYDSRQLSLKSLKSKFASWES